MDQNNTPPSSQPTAEPELLKGRKGLLDGIEVNTYGTDPTLVATAGGGTDDFTEITVDGTKSYFATRTDDHPHFFWEDEAKLTDAPSDQLVISQVPDAPEGAEIASVDVVIRLRRKP